MHGRRSSEGSEVGNVGTVIVLLLGVLALRAMAAHPSGPPVSGSFGEALRRWGADVVDGARTLSRLDAARRSGLDRPPWS
ncbi:hypothetical protein SAMN05216574_13011 [Blastococcus tunisiensis]|uniref:Uncharacterized protein n=1 Tax=Blastococcus tunisiensis TaxID=1798228 RepID=A0A1I2M5G0_9ACTN|nr:hypothetical protein SAMN05216574_13011 [Blastococcus sp. DSM 46838]